MRRVPCPALLFAATATVPPGAAAQSAVEPRIPFVEGVQLTWVISLSGEPDFESILTIERVDSLDATISLAWNRGADRRWKRWERTLSEAERLRARSTYYYAVEGGTNEFRGSLHGMISGAVLRDLEETGRSRIVILYPQVSARPFRGTLVRTEPGHQPFSVLLDGREVELPGIAVRSDVAGDAGIREEAVFLAAPGAGWILSTHATLEAGETDASGFMRLVRAETGAGRREALRALEESCRATLHDIYFATGSDALDAASDPALEAIGAVLGRHPDWTVNIVGHTDGIGGDEANLDLSRRRAERVRSALVERFGVPAAGLGAEGRGEREPVADNSTAEGRARNRRVELERPCGAGKERSGT